MIEVVNPATEEVVGTVAEGTPADVDAAVSAAVAAFPAWSRTSVDERAEVVRAVIDGLRARSEELAATMTREMGTPLTFSQKVQVTNPIAIAEGVAEVLGAGYFEPEEIGNSLVFREPVGVVAAITPWNFPLQQMVAKVVPALAAGNTVVLKPSELAPGTADLLAEIVAGATPEGVFQLVHGTGPVVGEALAAHPGVDMVSFTGSTKAGRRVSAVAAETVKRVALELGGKSACIVLDDADLGRAV